MTKEQLGKKDENNRVKINFKESTIVQTINQNETKTIKVMKVQLF